MSTVMSDKNVARFYAAAWIALYLTVYFFFKEALPEKYFRDSLLIQKLAWSGAASDWGGAYAIAAYIAHVLPAALISALVAALGSFMIWEITTSLRTIKGMIMIIPILIPFLVLNLMDFGKETFVIPLTYVIMWWTTRARSTPHAFISICVIYLLYGIFFREYYLIILAVFAGSIVIYKASLPLRLLCLLLVFVSIFAIPPKVFMSLQGNRDVINYVADSIFPVHTAIINPLTPDSALHFIVNYFYVLVRLTLPFLFRHSVNELVLFINTLFYGYLLAVGIRSRKMGPVSLLPLLFIAHIVVLFIFEPDEGSYMRHASSIIVYLLPFLRLSEQRRATPLREKEFQEEKEHYEAA